MDLEPGIRSVHVSGTSHPRAVRDMLADPSDLEIVESVVKLSHAFDRKVIAEGVETEIRHKVQMSLMGHMVRSARALGADILIGLLPIAMAALIALAAIVAGIYGADALLARRGTGRGMVPAE